MLPWLWAVLVLPAAAQEGLASRQLFHDAMILEGLYGDVDEAVVRYQTLIRNSGMDDRTRTDALVALGRALYDLGQVDLARASLIDGRASGDCNERCRDLLQLLVIDEESVRKVPALWTFDETDHGFFHPLDLQDQGTIKLVRLPDRSGALLWETVPPVRRDDRLEVGLIRPSPAPREVEFSATSLVVDVRLVITATDEQGQRYRLDPPIALPTGQRTRRVVALADLVPAAAGADTLRTERLTRIAIVVTSPTGAPNTLHLHEFAIR